MNEVLAIVLAVTLAIPTCEELARVPAVSFHIDGPRMVEGGLAVGSAGNAMPRQADGASSLVASAPTITQLKLVDGQHLDPLLAPVDIWHGGEIGGLMQRARSASTTGDAAALPVLSKAFWGKLGTALERRRVLGETKTGSRGDGR